MDQSGVASDRSLTVERAARLSRWLPKCDFPPTGTPLRCGVSGGADSLALLALAAASGCDVTAVHIDHRQRPENEASLVASYADEVGAAFESAVVDVEPGANLESRMRAARYSILGASASTGHTLDDQAETVLINLLRGSGIRGLGAMSPGVRRPILGLRRADTEAVCDVMGWSYFVDPTNASPDFVRNRVRHELLPLLNDISGRDVARLLARTAQQAGDTQAVIDRLAAEVDPTDALGLRSEPEPVVAAAVQAWIRSETGDEYVIDAASVERVLAVIRGDVKAAEVTGGWRIERSKQRLSIAPPAV